MITREQFWSRVDVGGVCWEWTGPLNSKGYGCFRPTRRGAYHMAHRYAWEVLVGPIPDGLVMDHLCRNRLCVNPDHIEPVTPRENLLRGYNHVAVAARATHCPEGHPYTSENVRVGRAGRKCRACRTFLCEVCGETRDRSSRTRHMRVMHTEEGTCSS